METLLLILIAASIAAMVGQSLLKKSQHRTFYVVEERHISNEGMDYFGELSRFYMLQKGIKKHKLSDGKGTFIEGYYNIDLPAVYMRGKQGSAVGLAIRNVKEISDKFDVAVSMFNNAVENYKKYKPQECADYQILSSIKAGTKSIYSVTLFKIIGITVTRATSTKLEGRVEARRRH